jgi:hypothetical protein
MKHPKHTPAPWKCYPSCDDDRHYSVVDADDNILTYDDGEHAANARLRAAAPELLEALQHARAYINALNPSDADSLAMYDAAIAKAGSK